MKPILDGKKCENNFFCVRFNVEFAWGIDSHLLKYISQLFDIIYFMSKIYW